MQNYGAILFAKFDIFVNKNAPDCAIIATLVEPLGTSPDDLYDGTKIVLNSNYED